MALFVEIVVPFFIWAPRRLRLAAAWLLIGLQVAIALTGNYNFFNLLAIALCLLLFDDASWAPRRGARNGGFAPERWPVWVPAAVAGRDLAAESFPGCTRRSRRRRSWPRRLVAMNARLEPFRVANGYGLFRVMTKERPEIIFEGSSGCL